MASNPLSRRSALLLALSSIIGVPASAKEDATISQARLSDFSRVPQKLHIYLGDEGAISGYSSFTIHGPGGEVLTFTAEQIMEALR